MKWSAVSPTCYRFLLLSVVPGWEISVAREFGLHLRALVRRNKVRDFEICKLFGTYDLLVLYEADDVRSDLINRGAIAGILHSTEVIAFAWSSGRSQSFTLQWIRSRPVVGLSLFKFKPQFSTLELEQLFVEHSMRERPNLRCLGTLGWSEAILISRGNSVAEVFRALHAANETAVSDGSRATAFPLKTFSVLGLKLDVVRTKRQLYRTLGSQPFEGKPFAQLFLSCRPEHITSLAEYAQELFRTEKVDVAVGARDLCVDLEGSGIRTWAEFVEKLLTLRAKGHAALFATHVQFQMLARQVPLASRAEAPKGTADVFVLSRSDIEGIAHLGESTREAVVRSFYVVNALIQSDLIADCFSDLVPFMQYLMGAIRAQPMAIDPADVSKRMERLRAGADQRSLGAYLGIESTEGRFSPFKGGIQRLLRAVEAVPSELFSAVSTLPWPGFVLVGMDRRYWHVGGTLNIPLEAAFKPSRWWGITHETAHALIELDRGVVDFSENGDLVREIELRIGVRRFTHDFNVAVDVLREVLADLIDYELAFKPDIASYLRLVWHYLEAELAGDRERDEMLPVYVLRSFVVWLVTAGRDVSGLQFEDVRDEFHRFRSKLAFLVPSLALPIDAAAVEKQVLRGFGEYKALIGQCVPQVRAIGRRFDRHKRKLQANTRQAVRYARRGKVFTGAFCATEFVAELATQSLNAPLPWQVEVAALLSLWDHYQRNAKVVLGGAAAERDGARTGGRPGS